MFGEWERERLERIIDRLLTIIDGLLKNQTALAVSAKGELNMITVKLGARPLFTFTEFDGPNGTGNKVKPSGPITFASDNPSVAAVSSNQRPNADGFGVDVDVVTISPGVANITGVDTASQNKVAAGDVLTVQVAAIAVSATGVLS